MVKIELLNLSLAFAVLVVTAGASEAAVFARTQFGGIGCEDSSSAASGNVFSQCSGVAGSPALPGNVATGDAFARAESGSVGASSSIVSVFGGALESFAQFNDNLSIGIDSGTLVIPVDIAGVFEQSVTGRFNGVGSSGSSGDLRISYQFSFGGTNAGPSSSAGRVEQFLVRELSVANNPSGVGTQVTNDFNLAVGGAQLGLNTLELPFSNGTASVFASVGTSASCDPTRGADGGVCTAESSFLNSARFLGLTVLDEQGLEVDTTVTSQSGFDYLTGHPAHIAPVPVPASLPLLVFAVMIFGAIKTRRIGASNWAD